MSDVTLSNGMVVDDQTGEIVEWPDVPYDLEQQIEALAEAHEYADRQAKGWEQEKRYLALQLGQRLEESGQRKLSFESVETWLVRGHMRYSAPLDRARAALDAGRITQEEFDRLPIKEFDAKAIREDDGLSPQQVEAVVEERWTGGHVRTQQAKKASPLARREGPGESSH